ncbi:MAG: YbaN family protein, partial [Cyclobacteriaceae bacterium]|nr:YbaN family protein [Cyclobacteriaceae bacterium]
FPAIPFILLAAFFFANSSDTLYQWMLRQKLLATLLAKARTKKGHTGFKLFVISQLWVSIIVALYLFVRDPYAIATILVAGTGCSIAMYTLMDR